METIYKYELELTDTQALSLPADAEILTIQQQGPSIFAWVKLDNQKPERDRTIVVCGTGSPLKQPYMRYITTIQVGIMVWHFFEF